MAEKAAATQAALRGDLAQRIVLTDDGSLPGVKRGTPPVVVRALRTAPLSAEDRQRAVVALTVMISQWWSGNRGRSAGADGESDQRCGATAE